MKRTFCVIVVLSALGTSLFAGGGQASGAGSGVLVNERGLPITARPVTVTIAINKPANSRTPYGDMAPVKDTEKLTNVHIEWTEIPFSGWTEKVNLLIASGDMPDAFLGGEVDLAKNLDAFTSIDESIAKYAPAIQNLFKERPDVKNVLTAPDGKIYSLPIGDESYNNMAGGGQLWINKVWLDSLGLAIPASIKEFEAVLSAFKGRDPNKNGKADEVPFAAAQSGDAYGRINPLCYSFGVGGFDLRVLNGKVIFAPAEKGFYDALSWFHSLFSRGLMDQESFIQNTQQYQSKYKGSDTVGAFLAFSPDYVVDTAMMGNFIALPPLSSTAGQSPAWPRGGRVGNQGFVISRTSKHRDVLIRLYDYLNSDLEIALTWNRGPKNVTWRMRGDGKWEIAAENQPKDMAYGVWRNSSAPGSQSPVFMKSAWVGPEKQHFSTSRDKLKVSSVSAYLPYLEKEYIPNNIIPADDASTRNLLWVEIESYLQRFAAQAVMQGINDAGWAAHLATLKQLKADEYTAITQKYYRPVK